MKITTFIAIAVLLTGGKSLVAQDKPTVVTTCGMVTDIVANVVGDHGTVEGLMGPGVDPHLYKPTRDDVVKLSQADIIFYSGIMLEGRMADTFARVARGGNPVYAVTEEIPEDYLMEPEEFEGHWDPHVWNDVSAWIMATEFVGKAMSQFDPDNAAAYKANADAYIARLEALDAYVKEVIASIPEEKRYLLTAHDAFGYFSRAYDINVKSVQGVSTASEAGVDDINEMVDFIVENEIGAIFVENITSDKDMMAIVEGAKARGHEVEIGGTLYSDAMGAPGTYEGTYIGMVDRNAPMIANSLGGEAPEKGMNGKLTHD